MDDTPSILPLEYLTDLLDVLTLEEIRDLLAHKIRENQNLSKKDRAMAAYFIDGENLPLAPDKKVGRQQIKGIGRTGWRDICIAIDYEKKYSKGMSEALFEEIKSKHGFKSHTTAEKALANGRRLLGSSLEKGKKNKK